ncbi:hypothetical protein ACTMTI_40100 [Nonomuraea sp. H19]|uniref:hypothetical protein n=1 Tax=Nonomuraea sp. H19 TaxID=3452206 RepID=UPI003F8BED3A
MRDETTYFHNGEAVEILVEGFLDDPFFLWTTPDERTRRALLEATFSLAVKAADAQGFLLLDERGVVILLPPGRRLYDEEEAARAQELTLRAFQRPTVLLKDYRRRLQAADVDDTAAWYLQYLAVPAAKRSQGCGSSLMRDILCHAAGSPLWLHTGRPANLQFYARFGLDVVATIPCEPEGPYVYTLMRTT